MKRALLDSNSRLVGIEDYHLPEGQDAPRSDELVFDDIDLPTNGTYKFDWSVRSFVPLGHGFPKPRRAPVSDSQALYSVISSMMRAGIDVGQTAVAWAEWYEDHIRQREDELTVVAGQQGRRSRGRR